MGNFVTANESTVRGRARRRGYMVYRSRLPKGPDNHGGYMLLSPDQNLIVLGSHFDATLDDIAGFLERCPVRPRPPPPTGFAVGETRH